MNGIEFIVAHASQVRNKPVDMKAAVIALAGAKSQRQIAFDLGLSRTTVYNILRRVREKGLP